MVADPVAQLPSPRLRRVRNATPFPHLKFEKMGKGRRFYDVVIVCGSFVLGSGRLQLAANHRGPILADRAWDEGNAALSSLKCATDILLRKPGSDVYVTGTARAPQDRPCREWPALLRVARMEHVLIQKVLQFTGPRCWRRGLLGWALSPAEPTTAVPLRYELAYGGWWYNTGDTVGAAAHIYEENPSGSGWFGTADQRHDMRARYAHGESIAAPQIEYLEAPVRSANLNHRVAGFGPVARHWQPRYSYAGSYDAAWLAQFQQQDVPDFPADFDEKFFHCAPKDQIIHAGLVGDEDLQLAGLVADAPAISARLPHIWLEAVCHKGSGDEQRQPLRLDTVHVDLETMRVHLTWRLTLDQDLDIVDVEIFDRLIANGRCTQAAFRGIRS